MRFPGMSSGDRVGDKRRQKTPEAWLRLRSLVPLGTPSAWLFLVRLHACRAGLRFTRHNNYARCCRTRQMENKTNQGGTTVSSRRGLVRAIGRKFRVCALAPP
jgi:hypothetical protein